MLKILEKDNPAEVGARCVSEKEMTAAMKRLGMSHAMRMTTSRNALSSTVGTS